MTTATIENTTAINYTVGQRVKDAGSHPTAGVGRITAIVPPFGTAGEWSYSVNWPAIGEGSGWRDCDLKAA